jgi:cyclase
MKDMGLVKGIGYDSWRRVGTIVPSVKVYNRRQVDELIVLDISATHSGRGPDIDEVKNFAFECFVPLTVGGGVCTLEHAQALLRSGADKVAVNTACYDNPELVSDIAQKYGTQCVVVGIDVRKQADGTYMCYSHSGKQARHVHPAAWAKTMEEMGAGEILISSIERDGTMKGYDIDLIKIVSQAVGIPVIASGGAGSYEDIYQAIHAGGAQAASAASIFHFTEQTPLGAKEYLAMRGIPVTQMHKFQTSVAAQIT